MTSDVLRGHRLSAPVLYGLLLIVFLILCWHYASGLNLWGDEAYSLDFVEGRTTTVDPSHLPMYYVLLKWLTSVVPGTNELALRLLHAVAFAFGLLFGTLAVRRLTGSATIPLSSLGIAILLPDFLFYATNLRMYSLVFLATMANVDAVSRVAGRDRAPTAWALAWYVMSAAALVAIDFPGLFYFGIGASYLAVNWLRARRWTLLPLLLLPLVPLLAFFVANESLFAELLRWRGEEAPEAFAIGPFEILKRGYLSLRPGLDLVYAAPLPSAIALTVPATLFAIVVFAASRQTLEDARCSPAALVIPLLALGWLIVVPTGFTFTRIFLPSQFFMIVVLARGIHSPQTLQRVATRIGTIVLVLVNLYQALTPIYRLDSAIPYRRIADDVAKIAVTENIDVILASDNSLNVQSIFRYLRDRGVNSSMRLMTVGNLERTQRTGAVPERPFLFVSHMGGSAPWVDVHGLVGRTPELVRGYVPLRELPYNDLWKRRYAERAGQADVIDLWLVR